MAEATTPHALTTNVHDTALIFEGGGMRAAYTAPVVATLLEAGIHADFVAGISAGSSNTVNYVSRDPARAKHSFVDLVEDPQFGGIRSFLRGDGYFNAHYIYEQSGYPGCSLPLDWETFRADPAEIRVGSFNATRGRRVWFTKRDMPDIAAVGATVRASSTLPILMPPVVIDGEIYVDGALGDDGGIPLDAAEAAGYERFLVVLTRPRGYVKKPASRGLLRLLRRRFPALPSIVEGVARRPERYNATRARLFELEREGRAQVFVPEHLTIANTETRLDRLESTYRAGWDQAQRELPRWRDFLGV
jgi:predicted patatin/cPLA2 family phospholipase